MEKFWSALIIVTVIAIGYGSYLAIQSVGWVCFLILAFVGLTALSWVLGNVIAPFFGAIGRSIK